MAEPLEISLFPKGDEGANLRWRNDPGNDFRQLLMNQGNHRGVVKAKANIISIANGTMTPNGQGATLIVLEFRFQSPQADHRFKRADIKLTFKDIGDGKTNSHHNLDPFVRKIAPDGDFALNPREDKSNVRQAWQANLNAGVDGLLGGGVGFDWEMTRDLSKKHYTTLGGTPENVRTEEYGKDNAAVWWMEEDKQTQGGIPKWFRTNFQLRRRDRMPCGF
ncbi:hypothetical protein F4779DRAFT_601951 [Xylariaceae sp. FL0662B]|nr:hypothetical protein F4779DRAFT_601951 [Xylariaceae sp. FL0662B]